jgi:hypothetical protein
MPVLSVLRTVSVGVEAGTEGGNGGVEDGIGKGKEGGENVKGREGVNMIVEQEEKAATEREEKKDKQVWVSDLAFSRMTCSHNMLACYIFNSVRCSAGTDGARIAQ